MKKTLHKNKRTKKIEGGSKKNLNNSKHKSKFRKGLEIGTKYVPYLHGITRSAFAAHNAGKKRNRIKTLETDLKTKSYLGNKTLSENQIREKYTELLRLQRERSGLVKKSVLHATSAIFADFPKLIHKFSKGFKKKTPENTQEQEPQEKQKELSLSEQARLEKLLHGYSNEYGILRERSGNELLKKYSPIAFIPVYGTVALGFASLIKKIKNTERRRQIKSQSTSGQSTSGQSTSGQSTSGQRFLDTLSS